MRNWIDGILSAKEGGEIRHKTYFRDMLGQLCIVFYIDYGNYCHMITQVDVIKSAYGPGMRD